MPISLSVVKRHYDVLGIASGSGIEEIKQAYRLQIQVWHPDRFLTNKGLHQRVEKQSKSINEAYCFLKTHCAEYGAEVFEQSERAAVDYPRLVTEVERLKTACRKRDEREHRILAEKEAAARSAQRARAEVDQLTTELTDATRRLDLWVDRTAQAMLELRARRIKSTALTAAGALALGFMAAAWFMMRDTLILVAFMIAFVFGTLTRYGIAHLRMNVTAFERIKSFRATVINVTRFAAVKWPQPIYRLFKRFVGRPQNQPEPPMKAEATRTEIARFRCATLHTSAYAQPVDREVRWPDHRTPGWWHGGE